MEHESQSELFPVGYHHLHDNVALNFQLNRFLPGARLEDFRLAASRIRDLRDWKREMLQLAERAEADGRLQNAFSTYRAAEFFILPNDPDKNKAYHASDTWLPGASCTISSNVSPERADLS